MRVQAYKLHLVPPDLRREEAMIQIADSLDYIQMITDDIFKNIQSRVTEYSNRLQSVCDRADLAHKKIDKIKGSSKATKVFSSYKYPGAEDLDEYKALFSTTNELQGKQQCSGYLIKSKHITPDEKILKEKLQFYNVRIPERQKEKNQMMEEGLGSLPKNLDSLSTLLLFNTSENPYKKYVMLDPLGAVTKTKKSLEEEIQGDGIGAAPITISQREQIEAIDKENYFYSPGMGEVPEMDVPLALPDLPGIADDLLYNADLGPSIAPSSLPIISGTVLPELPSLVPESPQMSELPMNNSAFSADLSELPCISMGQPINSNQIIAQAPPPPPPPPPSPPLTSPSSAVPSSSNLVPPDNKRDEKDKQETPKFVAESGDARANLLESIRRAGGSGKAKLRNIANRKIEAKKKKQEEKTVSGGGDLIGDLSKKLMMRRKGISGANRGGSVSEGSPNPLPTFSPDSAMKNISARIPPPMPSTKHTSEASDDDDWN